MSKRTRFDRTTDFDVNIMFKLLETDLLIDGRLRPVYGMISLLVKPARIGFGRKAIEYMVQQAEQHGKYCAVGFCRKHNLGFFEKCGFFNAGMHEDRVIVTSKRVERIVINEPW